MISNKYVWPIFSIFIIIGNQIVFSLICWFMQNEKYLLMAELVPFSIIPIGGHFLLQTQIGHHSVNRSFILLSSLLIWCLRLTIFSITRMRNFNRIALDNGIDTFLKGKENPTSNVTLKRIREKIELNYYWKNPLFDRQRKKKIVMFRFWFWHTCWISSLLTPVIIYHSYYRAIEVPTWTIYDFIGIFIWSIGFLIESISDIQRNIYRNGPAKRGASFLSKGLWFYSRHPNYFGEVMLWFGFWLMSSFCSSSFSPFLVIISFVAPLFSWISLTFITGIPIVEGRSDKKHHRSMAYKQWKWKTSPMIPLSPSFYGPLSLWCKKWIFFDHYQLQFFNNTSASPIQMTIGSIIPLFNFKHGTSSPIFRLVGSMKAAARQSISNLNSSLSPNASVNEGINK